MVNSDPNVYGDRKATKEMMSGAPMAKAQPVPAGPPITGLFAPSEMPNEAVTTGSPAGLGAGPEVLNLPARNFNPTQVLNRLAQNDPSGQIEMILKDLNGRGIV
jgi:hypothetical protein